MDGVEKQQRKRKLKFDANYEKKGKEREKERLRNRRTDSHFSRVRRSFTRLDIKLDLER